MDKLMRKAGALRVSDEAKLVLAEVLEEKALLIAQEAKKFAGREVIWKSPAGKEIKGKISDSHGNKGLVRAIFEKGLPGQARNTEAEVK